MRQNSLLFFRQRKCDRGADCNRDYQAWAVPKKTVDRVHGFMNGMGELKPTDC